MDVAVELAWFGASTFRLRIGGTVVFLDAYLDRVRADVAILAAAGRGNVDGEPTPQPLPEFIATQVELMQLGRVVLCHHDDWMILRVNT